MFITSVNDTGDKLFTGVNDTGDKFIAGVNDINPCHGFSVIARVIDTGEKVMARIRVCRVSMNTSFHGGSNETIGGRV